MFSCFLYALKYHSRSRVISICEVSGSFYNIGLPYLKQTSKGHYDAGFAGLGLQEVPGEMKE